MQSVQFGYSPRLNIEHTSATEIGEIYIPAVNWALMVACIGLVIGFGSSSNLAAAYGVAVTTTMVITTVLFSFWGANLVKIPDGGWFPLVVAALVFTLMTTWKTGHQILAARVKAGELPVQHFIDSIAPNPPHRVPRDGRLHVQ